MCAQVRFPKKEEVVQILAKVRLSSLIISRAGGRQRICTSLIRRRANVRGLGGPGRVGPARPD